MKVERWVLRVSCYLIGPVVQASTSGAADPGFDSDFLHGDFFPGHGDFFLGMGIFSRSSHTSGLEIGTPVATLPGAWHYRVSAETGCPDVSTPWQGGDRKLDLQRNFYLSVTACKIEQIHPWDTPACCWEPTKKLCANLSEA